MKHYDWLCHVCQGVNRAGLNSCIHCKAPDTMSYNDIQRYRGTHKKRAMPKWLLIRPAFVYCAMAILTLLFYVAFAFITVTSKASIANTALYLYLFLLPFAFARLGINRGISNKRYLLMVSIIGPALLIAVGVLLRYNAFNTLCSYCLTNDCSHFQIDLSCDIFPLHILYAPFLSFFTYVAIAISFAGTGLARFSTRRSGNSIPISDA